MVMVHSDIQRTWLYGQDEVLSGSLLGWSGAVQCNGTGIMFPVDKHEQ